MYTHSIPSENDECLAPVSPASASCARTTQAPVPGAKLVAASARSKRRSNNCGDARSRRLYEGAPSAPSRPPLRGLGGDHGAASTSGALSAEVTRRSGAPPPGGCTVAVPPPNIRLAHVTLGDGWGGVITVCSPKGLGRLVDVRARAE